MKRSEILQYALNELGVDCARCVLQKNCSDCRVEIMRNILLAEQKRSEGCAFCRNKENEHGFFIDGNVLFYEDGKLGTEGIIITTCPHCGRDLTEGESI